MKRDDMDTENVKNCNLNITMKTLTAMKTTLKAGPCAKRCFPVSIVRMITMRNAMVRQQKDNDYNEEENKAGPCARRVVVPCVPVTNQFSAAY